MANEIEKEIGRIQWPTRQDVTPGTTPNYQQGLDAVYSYAGDVRDLIVALHHFRDTGSQPYASAGVALVLMFSAYQHGDTYDIATLIEAESWISKIGPLVSQVPELAMVPVQLALLQQKQKKARSMLEQLLSKWPDNFFVAKAELWYWYNERNLEQCELWAQKALAAADSEGRKIMVLTAAAGCYAQCRAHDASIAAYEQLVQMQPNNAWHWHNLTIQYLNAGKRELATECNARAMALGEFKMARSMQKTIEDTRKPYNSIVFGATILVGAIAAAVVAYKGVDARLWGLAILAGAFGTMYVGYGVSSMRTKWE